MVATMLNDDNIDWEKSLLDDFIIYIIVVVSCNVECCYFDPSHPVWL